MIPKETSWKAVATWTLAIALAATFIVSGLGKIGGTPLQVASFDRWGFPLWFAYVVGLIEIFGGAALLSRAVTPFAASLLGGTMVGAILTHVIYDEAAMVVVPSVLLVLLATLGWARRPDYLRSHRDVLTTSDQRV